MTQGGSQRDEHAFGSSPLLELAPPARGPCQCFPVSGGLPLWVVCRVNSLSPALKQVSPSSLFLLLRRTKLYYFLLLASVGAPSPLTPLHCARGVCWRLSPPRRPGGNLHHLRLFTGEKGYFLVHIFILKISNTVFKMVTLCCNMIGRQSGLPVFASEKAGHDTWGAGSGTGRLT